MKVEPISNQGNINYRGLKTKLGNLIEGSAATVQTKTNPNRKTMSIELHNALVKLTAYRVALLSMALSGFLGFKVSDKISDNDIENFASTIQATDIDTSAGYEIKDMNHDGSADLVLRKKDSSMVILDLKNSDVLMESTGFKSIE